MVLIAHKWNWSGADLLKCVRHLLGEYRTCFLWLKGMKTIKKEMCMTVRKRRRKIYMQTERLVWMNEASFYDNNSLRVVNTHTQKHTIDFPTFCINTINTPFHSADRLTRFEVSQSHKSLHKDMQFFFFFPLQRLLKSRWLSSVVTMWHLNDNLQDWNKGACTSSSARL